jgi:hypothetical protein
VVFSPQKRIGFGQYLLAQLVVRLLAAKSMEADPLETNDEYRAIEGERSLSNFKYSLN